MDLYFSQKQGFEVQNILMMDLFQLLSSPDVNWWTGVVWITCGLLWCFYQLFGLSFWRHPFTAEHPLLSKWCNATFLQIWWWKKLILILDGLRVSTCSSNDHFCVNYSLHFQQILILGWTVPWRELWKSFNSLKKEIILHPPNLFKIRHTCMDPFDIQCCHRNKWFQMIRWVQSRISESPRNYGNDVNAT